MSHGQEKCVFCKKKLSPENENQNTENGWVRLQHTVGVFWTTCLKHEGIKDTFSLQEGAPLEEALEAAQTRKSKAVLEDVDRHFLKIKGADRGQWR